MNYVENTVWSFILILPWKKTLFTVSGSDDEAIIYVGAAAGYPSWFGTEK